MHCDSLQLQSTPPSTVGCPSFTQSRLCWHAAQGMTAVTLLDKMQPRKAFYFQASSTRRGSFLDPTASWEELLARPHTAQMLLPRRCAPWATTSLPRSYVDVNRLTPSVSPGSQGHEFLCSIDRKGKNIKSHSWRDALCVHEFLTEFSTWETEECNPRKQSRVSVYHASQRQWVRPALRRAPNPAIKWVLEMATRLCHRKYGLHCHVMKYDQDWVLAMVQTSLWGMWLGPAVSIFHEITQQCVCRF